MLHKMIISPQRQLGNAQNLGDYDHGPFASSNLILNKKSRKEGKEEKEASEGVSRIATHLHQEGQSYMVHDMFIVT